MSALILSQIAFIAVMNLNSMRTGLIIKWPCWKHVAHPGAQNASPAVHIHFRKLFSYSFLLAPLVFCWVLACCVFCLCLPTLTTLGHLATTPDTLDTDYIFHPALTVGSQQPGPFVISFCQRQGNLCNGHHPELLLRASHLGAEG